MKTKVLFILMIFVARLSIAQVAINGSGSSADNSAMLDVSSTTKGILVPRMTTAQRTALSSPATGLLVYDSTLQSFYYYNGTAWKIVGDDNDWTKGTNSVYVTSDSVGIGTSNPAAPLHVNGLIWQTGTGHSVFLGEGAGQKDDLSNNNNTGIGYYALSNDTAGDYNTAVGYYSLNEVSNGYENTAVGAQSLYHTSSGFKNVAVGVAALFSNTQGRDNIAIGYQALNFNTTGNYNIAIGSQSQYENVDGHENVSMGFSALKQNNHGYHNVAVGYIALQVNSLGYKNTAVGYGSLNQNTTGYNNTALGSDAFATGSNYHNSTAIGFSAAVTADDMIRLGDNNVNWIGGHSAWQNTSDGRFKRNVRENVPGLGFIMKLRPVTFTWDLKALDRYMGYDESKIEELAKERTTQEKTVHTGFIAQEVEKAAREAGFDFDAVHKPQGKNDPYSLAYGTFVVPLVKAVQEQEQKIEQQQKTIDDLKKRLETMNKLIQEMKNK